MALKIRPPTHRADALGVFVSVHDSAWDDALYTADLQVLLDAALAEKQAAAEAEHIAKHPGATADEIAALRAACKLSDVEQHRAKGLHPVVRYVTGKTRYQLGARDHAPDGSPCTVRERYLTKGQACEFTLRRLRSEVYQSADEIVSTGRRLTEFVRASLKAITSPEWNWTLPEDCARVPPDVIEALHESDPALLLEIGTAVIALCRPLDEAETPR